MYGEGKRYPSVCVSAVILDSEGRVLITERSEKVWFPGTWCLPGGHVEGGESWISALKKEVMEETGLVIEDPILHGIYSEPEFNILNDEINKVKRPFVSASFVIRKFSGEPRLTSEISQFKWAHPTELPEKLIPIEGIKLRDAIHFERTPFVR